MQQEQQQHQQQEQQEEREQQLFMTVVRYAQNAQARRYTSVVLLYTHTWHVAHSSTADTPVIIYGASATGDGQEYLIKGGRCIREPPRRAAIGVAHFAHSISD